MPPTSRLRVRRALRRVQRKYVLVVAGTVAFAVVLALWAGRAPDDVRAEVPAPTPSATGPTPTTTPSSTSSAAPAGPVSSGALPSEAVLSLPPLNPVTSGNDIRDASRLHAVTLEAASDKPILQVAYAIRAGTPPNGYRSFVERTFTVRSPATGDGVLAQFAVQATSDATYIKCSIRVDGVLKNTRTVKGPYSVAFCVA